MSGNNVSIGTSPTWTTGSNWTSGAAPTANQDVFLTSLSTSFTLGLNNASVNLNTLNHVMDFTGTLGLNGTANTYLQIGAVTGNIGQPIAGGGNGAGSNLFNWNAGTASTTINVFTSANSGATTGQAPVKLLGSALVVNVTGGIISIAALQTETATVSTLSVVSSGAGVTPQVFLGAGCKTGTITQNGGVVFNASQLVVTNAHLARTNTQMNYLGSGGFTALIVDQGAKINYNGSGSVSTLTLTGIIDLSGGGGPVTFANTVLYGGARFNDPLGRAIFTNPYTLSNCALKDVFIDLGQGRVT